MKPTLLTLVALTAAPLHAGEVVNDAQVSACLSDTRGDVSACIAVLEAPCAHHRATGLMRACMFRLRERWERQIALSAAPLPSVRELAAICPRAGGDPVAVSIARNRCWISVLAARWARAQ